MELCEIMRGLGHFILIAITIKLVFIDASGQRSQSETLGMVEYVDLAGRFHGFVV